MVVKSKKQVKPKRRSPIARAEGERRLIEAARKLIRDKPFSEVGVRDIAQLADVNHGFVHTWFGGKNELLLAVVRQELLKIAEGIASAPAGTPAIDIFDPDVVALIRLVLWLDLEGVETGPLFQDWPVIDALTTRYISIENIDPSIAREAATQAVAIGLGAGIFGPLLDMHTPANYQPVMSLWRHVVGLLSKHPPA